MIWSRRRAVLASITELTYSIRPSSERCTTPSEKKPQPGERDDGGQKTGCPRPVEGRDQKLRSRKKETGDKNCRQDFHALPPAAQNDDQPERHQERQGRDHPPDDSSQEDHVDAAHGGRGRNRHSRGCKSDR